MNNDSVDPITAGLADIIATTTRITNDLLLLDIISATKTYIREHGPADICFGIAKVSHEHYAHSIYLQCRKEQHCIAHIVFHADRARMVQLTICSGMPPPTQFYYADPSYLDQITHQIRQDAETVRARIP